MTLSTLAILIGASTCVAALYFLIQPQTAIKQARAFPRSEPIGWVLMLLGAGWFVYNLNYEAIADFAAYKKYMLIGFATLGILTCVFVRDYLAVRGRRRRDRAQFAPDIFSGTPLTTAVHPGGIRKSSLGPDAGAA